MKYLLLAILMIVAGESWGQVKRDTTISLNKDTSITIEIKDTLSIKQISKKRIASKDEVVFLSTKGKNINYNRLIIYFKDFGVYSITPEYSATFILTNGTSFSLPYSGGSEIYSDEQLASFSINISKSLEVLKNNSLKTIKLGTSTGGHEIILEDRFQQKISNMIKAVLDN